MLNEKTILRLVLTATLGTGLVSAAANAAEADGWTGFYAGASAGPQFDVSKWKATSVGPNDTYGVDPTTAEQTLDAAHFRLGGFVGWSMLAAPGILAGVEGDIYGLTGPSAVTKPGLPGASYFGAAPADTISEGQRYDASLRGRVGTWVDPDLLLYGTAGVAFRDLFLKGNCPGNGAASWCGVPEAATLSRTLTGWTVGAGGESRINDRWSVRLEYRYAGYGSTNVSMFGANNQGADAIGGKVDLNTHIVTLGVAYHFGM